MKKFKDFINETKDKAHKKLLQERSDNPIDLKEPFKKTFDQKEVKKMNVIAEINKILKFRDPILEKMTYEIWLTIPQNKEIAELNEYHAQRLYEQDMDRADKVQAAGRASGGGVRKKKVVAAEAVTYYWDPTKLPGCRLWLDASDATTIVQETLPAAANVDLTSSFPDVVCWLDAGDTGSLTVDGSNKISQWRDKSGNNNHFGQTVLATQPILSASSFQGGQSVLYDDQVAAQYLSASNIFMTKSGDTTIFAVAKTNRVENKNDWILNCDGNDYGLIMSQHFGIYSYGSSWQYMAQTKLGEPYYCTWNFSSSFTAIDGYINGAHNVVNRPATSKPISSEINVGASSFPFNGYITEMIFFTRSLADNERISIERYLSNKYNIPAVNSSSVRYKQWTDKSGQGNHGRHGGWAYTPQYTSSAGSQSFGFYPADSAFDGIAYGFRCGTTGSVIQDKSATVFAVFTPTSLSGYKLSFGTNEARNNFRYSLGTYNTKLTYYTEGNNWATSQELTNTQRVIASWLTDGTAATVQFYKNGTGAGLDSSTAANEQQANLNFTVGTTTYDQYGLQGNIHEVLVYTGSITGTDRAAVETYLQNKWDITVATQSSDVTPYSVGISNWSSKVGSISATQTSASYRPTTGSIDGKKMIFFSGSSDSTAPYLEITGAAVAWEPTDIVSCSLWLDADDASSMTISGSNISEWRNKSVDDTGLFDGVQSNSSYQPTTVASEINGRSVVRFDGSDDKLDFSGSTSRRAPSSTGGEITSFIVMKKTAEPSPSATEMMMAYGLDSSFVAYNTDRVALWYDRNMYSPSYASMIVYVNTGWGITYDANSTSPSMFSFARDTSSHQFYHTGSHVTAVSDVETTLNPGVFYPPSSDAFYGRYGAFDGGTMPFYGDIAELICYSRKLSTTERATVETYLQNKWNITVATQSADPVLNTNNTYDVPTPPSLDFVAGTDAYTIFVAHQQNSGSGYDTLIGSGPQYALSYDRNNALLKSDFGTGTVSGSNTHGSTFHLASSLTSTTLNKVYVTGTLSATGAIGSAVTGSSAVHIGAQEISSSNITNRLQSGSIGEILVYSGSLTNFERKQVEEYLYNKWEIETSASY